MEQKITISDILVRMGVGDVIYDSIDFCLLEPSHGHPKDHEWLENHGYEITLCYDYSYHVNGLSGLSASSCGDWGDSL